ncbi:MAG: hypothetical protein Ta2E_02840 [Mycoplasmoidaceae bacterium]|nr:MAG: hypothetical protein Ta2E_02840 [Mycoplasmoidaceae bacterium]
MKLIKALLLIVTCNNFFCSVSFLWWQNETSIEEPREPQEKEAEWVSYLKSETDYVFDTMKQFNYEYVRLSENKTHYFNYNYTLTNADRCGKTFWIRIYVISINRVCLIVYILRQI